MMNIDQARLEVSAYIRISNSEGRDRDEEFGKRLLRMLIRADHVTAALENEVRLMYATSESMRTAGVPSPTRICFGDPPPSWDNAVRTIEECGA